MDPKVSEGSPFRKPPRVPALCRDASGKSLAGGAAVESNSQNGESEALLLALAEAVEQRDPHLARHCERLAFTSVALGMALHLERGSLIALYRGGFLHDIGKVGIPDEILFQPTRLTPEQWDIMRTHTVRGERICRHVKAFRPVLPIIRHHHERWDGCGYPDGLRGNEIPLLARILQVADIYDALTSSRPYKPAYSAKEALRILETETELGLRDPEIVNLFLRLHGSVISRIDELSLNEDCRFETMRSTLSRLGDAVNGADRGELSPLRPNGRTSFPLPQSEPESDFPWAAADR